MSTPSESRSERRARKKADWIAENPNPYHEWPGSADSIRSIVQQATGQQTFTWSKAKTEKPRVLTNDDLSVAFWAVKCTADKGLNYGQLDHAFKVCVNKGCHRNKAAAVLDALQRLNLIEQTGNYSKGGRGNVYRPVRKNPTAEETDEWLATLRPKTHH